ncbi:MAG: transcriptional repressor [Deltaproteobacteria bacterium]|nr:transcriptional repressor [Deltaproteobacteria bacterium]MBI4374605.1 transcriptional repressor [Deltaproteobacteria bacterium]
MESKLENYKRYLKTRGLKSTRQRDLIVSKFFQKHQHLTVDELLDRVRKKDQTIGYATVYRTLKLLTESGLAFKREFGGGKAKFEHLTDRHHDHLICVRCGDIIEFENREIEALQEKVCRSYRFSLIRHKMELYGACRKCQRREEKNAGY